MSSLLAPFIVLIERRRLRVALSAALTAAVLAVMGLHARSAAAEPVPAQTHRKVARDLNDEADASRNPRAKWARDVRGVRHVQAIVVSNSHRPGDDRPARQVLRTGRLGACRAPAVHALTVQMPASRVHALAQRGDVVSVSPNRGTQRTASTLESITGALTSNVRTNSTKTSYTRPRRQRHRHRGARLGRDEAPRCASPTPRRVARVKRNVSMLNTDAGQLDHRRRQPTPRCSPAAPRWPATRPRSTTTTA